MIILDTLLWGGLRFILTRIAETVEGELDDETNLREELLAAQMRVELGEMTEEEFADLERAILARLREIRAEREGGPVTVGGDMRIAGVEATAWDDAEAGVSDTGEAEAERGERAEDEIAVPPRTARRSGARRARPR